MTIRSTFAFDLETAQRIRSLADKWQVSQAEVIRRAVRLAEENATPSAAAILEEIRQAPSYTPNRAAKIIAKINRLRKESWDK